METVFKKVFSKKKRERKKGIQRVVSVFLATVMVLGVAPEIPQLNVGVTKVEATTQTEADKLRNKVVEIALAEEGYHEKASADLNYLYKKNENNGSGNYTKYTYDLRGHAGGGDNWAWCAIFVAWCMKQAGVPTSVYNWKCDDSMRATSASAKNYMNSATVYTSMNDNIKPGDIVLYSSHIGIVYKTNGTSYTTIEGNTSNEVRVVSNPSGVQYYIHIDYIIRTERRVIL